MESLIICILSLIPGVGWIFWLSERQRAKQLESRVRTLELQIQQMAKDRPRSRLISEAVIRGKVVESLAPLLPDFPVRNPKRIAFVGGALPTDYVI